MELEVMKPNRLSDGQHAGKIVGVESRDKPFEYVDIVIETNEAREIRAGYPRILTVESKLGMLLKRFGQQLMEGNIINPELVLKGKECVFVCINETTNRGTFPKVISESLKPK